MPDRVAVAFSMDQVRCRLGAFETAWAAPPVSQQRVLVLRCGGLASRRWRSVWSSPRRPAGIREARHGDDACGHRRGRRPGAVLALWLQPGVAG